MFNLYQHMKDSKEGASEPKESLTTGHDRFCQARPLRSTYRKKKRRGACRRAQSAAELNPDSIAAANRRNNFGIRSVSTDREESEEENSEKTPLVAHKIDSLAKMLFNRSIISSGKSSPEPLASPRVGERTMESAAVFALCTEYLSQSTRYALVTELNTLGTRPNKFWYTVHDNSIKTDRLLTLVPLSSKCMLEDDERSRSLIAELFRAVHHPYIYPVLELQLYCGHALAVMPINPKGSLKDLIYRSKWNDEFSRKYVSVGGGLPEGQVARFGRQLLEGLLFLRDKGFPPFRHLHAGNVMVQNGVARICGLENTLVGAPPRCPVALTAPLQFAEPLCLGRVLFEMCAGADLDLARLPDLLHDYPQVVEIIELIFGPRTPSLHELLLCELFRKIDLREMKGSCLPNFNQRLSRSCLSLLGEVARRQPGGLSGVSGTSGVSGSCTPPRRAATVSPSTPPSRRMLATCVVQPMDMIKTRMQLLGPEGKNMSAATMGRNIIATDGVRGLYKGLSAALFRQATYTTGRLGVFNVLVDTYTETYGVPNFGAKILIGTLAGGIGAFIGTPAEVCLIRMTADGRLPPDQRRNYTHVFNALARIVKEEGVTTLWRGAGATVTRAMVVNAAQLGTYAQAREALLDTFGEGITLHFVASMISGLVTVVSSQPLDVVKTRVQNAAKGTSQIGVLRNVIKNEGIPGLWSGFLPTYAKVGPHTVLTFIFMEQLNSLYLKLAYG